MLFKKKTLILDMDPWCDAGLTNQVVGRGAGGIVPDQSLPSGQTESFTLQKKRQHIERKGWMNFISNAGSGKLCSFKLDQRQTGETNFSFETMTTTGVQGERGVWSGRGGGVWIWFGTVPLQKTNPHLGVEREWRRGEELCDVTRAG